MSHGEEGEVVLGTDGDKFEINEIYQIVGECKMLSNKPKMVFIQACRGGSVPQADGEHATVNKPGDFFMSFPTFEGHLSFRDREWQWLMVCKGFVKNTSRQQILSQWSYRCIPN